jgi:hypothetical protein
MEVMSTGSPQRQQTGKFCMRQHDTPKSVRLMPAGTNGSHPLYLKPLATAVISKSGLRQPLHDDGYERVLSLVLALEGDTSYFTTDYFTGMQIELDVDGKEDAEKTAEARIVSADCFFFPERAMPNFIRNRPPPLPELGLYAGCPRLITGYNADTKEVWIYPPWKLERKAGMQGYADVC